jgi:hypothetical protein
MKRTYEMHVPVEMYGYIGISLEGTVEEAVQAYREVSEAVKVKSEPMPRNEFNEFIDLVLKGKPIQDDPGIIEKMSPEQRLVLNECKKAIKRIKSN